MRQSLQVRNIQQLSMTPQLRQAIRLLQLSSVELVEEIQQQLENNPVLEQEDDDKDQVSTDTLDSQPNWDDAPFAAGRHSDFSDQQHINQAAPQTLADHLVWQLELERLTLRDRTIGYCLIDALDERGFLTAPLDEIADASYQLLCDRSGNALVEQIEIDEVQAVLHRIQQFEPTGVAARHLAECLSLQLLALPDSTPWREETLTLLKKLGDDPKLKQLARLDPNSDSTRQMLALLRQLDPEPAATFGNTPEEHVLPDVIVQKQKGRWQVMLNGQLQPRLSLNPYYTKLAKETGDAQTGHYLRQHMQEARWFIKSLQSRQETLLLVAGCILEMQKDFFLYGPEAMKPMTLAEVADHIDVHESTVSRITTRKYLHCPLGLFELKYFFSSHLNTEGGGECSSTAIRAIIKKLVAEENPRKPLTDNSLTSLIGDQGIKVARRTVAKYREALHIPSSSQRKRVL